MIQTQNGKKPEPDKQKEGESHDGEWRNH
jgi:hypothetical protein